MDKAANIFTKLKNRSRMKKLVKGWGHDLGAARILRQKGHGGRAAQLEGLADWKAKKIQEQYLNLKALGKI